MYIEPVFYFIFAENSDHFEHVMCKMGKRAFLPNPRFAVLAELPSRVTKINKTFELDKNNLIIFDY
jgi:hypothetical protein